jgi:hypothetical protein
MKILHKITCFVLIAFMVCSFVQCGKKLLNYNAAKADILKLYNQKKEELQKVAETAIENNSAKDIKIPYVSHISLNEFSGNAVVCFDIDLQGIMLGGQYWGIYYSPNDTPCFEYGQKFEDYEIVSGIYIWRELSGNNIYATERISPNWFFWYMDYDGNRIELPTE